MSNKAMTEVPIAIFMYSLLIFAFCYGVIFQIGLNLEIKSDVNLFEAKRTTIQLSENILSSELTESLGIFNKEELDKYDGTNTEPYIHSCNYAYKLEVEDENRAWSFGYSGNAKLANKFKFPAAIDYPDGIHPANLTISLYSSKLIESFCYITGDEKTIERRCYNPTEGNICKFSVTKEDNNICISGMSGKECRNFGGI